MAPLRLVVAVLALAAASPAQARSVADWRHYIAEASARFGVPAQWIEDVIRAESGGRTMLGGRPIVSPAGAMGLMQLMPATWSDMRRRLKLGADPHAPRDNILAGTFYLRLMYDRFGYPGLFAAYNAGPASYAAFLAGRRSLPAETRLYLASLAGPGAGRPYVTGPSTPAPQPRPAIFFAVRHGPASAPEHGAANTLFVALRAGRESESVAPAPSLVTD
jgi:soluble lytic murein transglycosylase-like protein